VEGVIVDREPRFLKVPEAELQGVARTSLDSPAPTLAQLDRKRRSIAIIEALGRNVSTRLRQWA